MNTEKKVKLIINEYIKNIPDFILTTDETHFMVYNDMCKILSLYDKCIVGVMFDNERISDMNYYYYTYLLDMWNIDKELYSTTANYLGEIYESLRQILEEEELYEAEYNLYHLVSIGTHISEDINEDYDEK